MFIYWRVVNASTKALRKLSFPSLSVRTSNVQSTIIRLITVSLIAFALLLRLIFQLFQFFNLFIFSSFNSSAFVRRSVIELCDIEPDSVIPRFSRIFENGKQQCLPVSAIADDSQSFIMKSSINNFLIDDGIRPQEFSNFMQKLKQWSKFFQSEYALSSFQQFFVLLQMFFVKILRNRIALTIQLFHHIGCGLCIGIIFFNAANDGDRMFDHLKFCMGAIFFVVYTQIMVPILQYPQELRVVKKECFNRWYSLSPYYLALTISRMPFQILFNLIFSSLVYFLAGLPVEFDRFSMFALIGIITSFVSEGLGLWIGATFNVTVSLHKI